MRSMTSLVVGVLCMLFMIQTTMALYGLCSTDWFTEGCFDNNDECQNMGGECRHDGYGDHGEGCACMVAVMKSNRLQYEPLTRNHFKSIPGNPTLTQVLNGKLQKKLASVNTTAGK